MTLCIVGVALIAVGNLRGVRESGRLFALPTYLFLGAYFLLIGWGGVQWALGATAAARARRAERRRGGSSRPSWCSGPSRPGARP